MATLAALKRFSTFRGSLISRQDEKIPRANECSARSAIQNCHSLFHASNCLLERERSLVAVVAVCRRRGHCRSCGRQWMVEEFQSLTNILLPFVHNDNGEMFVVHAVSFVPSFDRPSAARSSVRQRLLSPNVSICRTHRLSTSRSVRRGDFSIPVGDRLHTATSRGVLFPK